MGVSIDRAAALPVDRLAAALRQRAVTGAPGAASQTVLAEGEGWHVVDFLCTSGPQDRPFENCHPTVSITLVRAGLFVYRSTRGMSLMSPGALVLGQPDENFASFYQHAPGSHCLSFRYDPALFAELASGIGGAAFDRQQLPPLAELAPLLTRAERAEHSRESLEGIGLELAGAVIRLAGRGNAVAEPSGRDRARVAAVLRLLSQSPGDRHDLATLADIAGLSRFHFLRTFKRVTGTTPHQWLLRARLRRAAERLAAGDGLVTQVALEVGFDDLANFIRAFRREFGISPGRYRAEPATA